jgi:hypothetical protein
VYELPRYYCFDLAGIFGHHILQKMYVLRRLYQYWEYKIKNVTDKLIKYAAQNLYNFQPIKYDFTSVNVILGSKER